MPLARLPARVNWGSLEIADANRSGGVWQVSDWTTFKTISGIMLLDVKGDVTKGEILR